MRNTSQPAASTSDVRPVTGGVGPSVRSALWSGLIGVCLVGLLGTAVLLDGDAPLGIDAWWHDLMVLARTDAGLSIANGLDVVGGTLSMFIVGVVLLLAFLIGRQPWSALTVAAAMLAAESAAAILKVLFARPRPVDSLSDTGLASFPSGHTTLAAAVTIVIALLVRRRVLWLIAVCWIVLMAWSRTYLEAHWLSDTVAGALLGASAALLVWGALSLAISRWNRRTPGVFLEVTAETSRPD